MAVDYRLERLKARKQRLTDIDSLLAEGTLDIQTRTKLNKERAQLTSRMTNQEQARERRKDPDPEIQAFGKEEYNRLTEEIGKKREELKIALLPKDENDDKNIIREIRGAAGGDEANIFAGDLFRRYSHYAANKGWKIEILDSDPTPLGGYSLISFRIKGKGAYAKLKFESGAHRVQRVPVTEANGRIQTSTATVLVRPELEHTTIKINPADLKIDTYHSSGAGGQNGISLPIRKPAGSCFRPNYRQGMMQKSKPRSEESAGLRSEPAKEVNVSVPITIRRTVSPTIVSDGRA